MTCRLVLVALLAIAVCGCPGRDLVVTRVGVHPQDSGPDSLESAVDAGVDAPAEVADDVTQGDAPDTSDTMDASDAHEVDDATVDAIDAGDTSDENDAEQDAIDEDTGAPDVPDVSDAGPADAPMTCSSCHGDERSSAPPRDTTGNTGTSARGVGAHRTHLRASAWHREVVCSDCHVVPATIDAPGHIDSPANPQLTWGAVATSRGATPAFDGVTCTGVYCHGTTLHGGEVTTPRWTVTDGTQSYCGSCHAVPPPAPHPPVTGPSCAVCHPFSGLVPLDRSTHINGVLEVTATCGACHGVPPRTAAHATHFGTPATPPVATYGDLRNAADYDPAGPTTYMFGCGNCHPLDSARHMDGHVDVELYNSSAPSASLKARNAPTASYSGGTCTGVYCHSSGQQVPTYVTSPQWTGRFSLPHCANCHGNPPAYPSGGAGSTSANLHLVLADDGWEFGHYLGLPGPWHTSYHGTRGSSPITCQTCHFRTVDPANLGPGGFYYLDTEGSYDLGGTGPVVCGSCHTGTGTAPATGSGRIVPLFHVNGTREVEFDRRMSVPSTVTGLPTGANRPRYPYWVAAIPGTLPPDSAVDGTTFSFNLSNSAYDPATRRCTSVPCHLGQSYDPALPMLWGETPVGNVTCNACHMY